jgi:hypothetical protein
MAGVGIGVGCCASTASLALAQTGDAGAPVGPCHAVALHLRCPDLVMSEPSHVHLDRSTEPGRVLLRSQSSIDNVGLGPLKIQGFRTGPTTMMVLQVIYDRGRRAHRFRIPSRLDLKYVEGSRYGRAGVPDARYWKFRDAAAFQLWKVDANNRTVRLVRTGPKLDYCFRDLRLTRPSQRSPHRAVFGACSQNGSARRVTLGTSVGWSDIYPYEYPEQWIDVTGLAGRYAYVQIADPQHQLLEFNFANNVSETYVSLPSGRVLGHRVGVTAP